MLTGLINKLRSHLSTYFGMTLAQLGVIVALLLVVLAGAGVLFWLNRPQPVVIKEVSESKERTKPHPSTTEAPPLQVHVVGAVQEPGVYQLKEGLRASDALQAAGGPQPDADLNIVNLAARLRDGQRLYIPKKGEVVPGSSASDSPLAPGDPLINQGDSAAVDLNNATPEQIDSLPGIGPVLAKRIIEYRESHGGFRSVADLKKVEGIGAKKYEDLKDRVTVG